MPSWSVWQKGQLESVSAVCDRVVRWESSLLQSCSVTERSCQLLEVGGRQPAHSLGDNSLASVLDEIRSERLEGFVYAVRDTCQYYQRSTSVSKVTTLPQHKGKLTLVTTAACILVQVCGIWESASK